MRVVITVTVLSAVAIADVASMVSGAPVMTSVRVLSTLTEIRHVTPLGHLLMMSGVEPFLSTEKPPEWLGDV